MAAAPCHHSKDQPEPTHRGRDRLRRRRQRPSQVRSKTSRARPCEASGALLLSNGGTGGGHAACTLWPPPAPFGYFPARGKYLVRPQADETSHKKQISCRRQEKGLPFFFPYRKGFRLCGGDQRAFRSPFGNLRPLATSRNLCKKQLPCRGQENAFLSRITNTFASAEATRELPPSPPEPLSMAKNIPSTAWRIRNIKNPRPSRPKAAEARVSILPKDSSFSR